MADRPEPKKSITEHVEEALQGLLDVLDNLVNPAPKLVPIPIRRPRR